MRKLSKIVSVVLSLALCLGMASPAFAASFTDLQNAIDGVTAVEDAGEHANGTKFIKEDGAERYGYGWNDATNEKEGYWGIEAWDEMDNEGNTNRNIQLNEDIEREKGDKGISIDGRKNEIADSTVIDLNGKIIDANPNAVLEKDNPEDYKTGLSFYEAEMDENGNKVAVRDENGDKIKAANVNTGAVITVTDADLTIVDSSATTYVDDDGETHYVAGTGTGTITGGNNPGSGGGGLRITENSDITVKGGNIVGNKATFGGGIGFFEHNVGRGDSSLKVDGVTFSGNFASANHGGGICVQAQGGLKTVTIANSHASDNVAKKQAGIYIVGVGQVAVKDCTIQNNTGHGWSSGINITNVDNAVIDNIVVKDNLCFMGPALGIRVRDGGTASVTGCTITGNESQGDGFGIEIVNANGTNRIVDCTVCGNTIWNETIKAKDQQIIIDGIRSGGFHTEKDSEGGTYEVVKQPTCTVDGEAIYTCSTGMCHYSIILPAHHTPGEPTLENEVPAQVGVEGSYDLVIRCTVCGDVISSEHVIIPALPAPAIPDDGGADAAPDAATIADQEVPLAGLMPLYMLLEELRQYEEIPEIELPEDFKWIDHAYAQAIYWGLQEELVVDTEEEPLDPDEALTVGLMREVLVNFVERYLGLDNFVVVLAGEDDELVMDLGERLTAFYTELETALAKQEKAA